MGKIIITGPFLKSGGVAQFVNNLSPFLDNEVFLFRRGKRKSKNILSFLLPFLDILRYTLYILKIKPKRIIINSSLGNVGIFRDGFFIFISKTIGVKTVLYIHGFNEDALKLKALIQFGYFKADKIFVLASKFKKQLIELGYNNPIEVTYNPVNDLLIQLPVNRINKSKGKVLRILMMSRIESSKGIFIGLKAMKDLKEEKVEMHIAGIGSELNRAKEFVRNNCLTKIHFYGFVSGIDKVNLLKNTDILFFPTFHNEGLPINVLEGLVMGLCIITRPVAGIIDLRNEYNLIISESTNEKDYVKIIRNLLNGGLPIDEMRENQLKAKKDFAPQLIFEKLYK